MEIDTFNLIFELAGEHFRWTSLNISHTSCYVRWLSMIYNKKIIALDSNGIIFSD